MEPPFPTAPLPSTSATSSSTVMDSRIWRRLPQPLLDRVLAFLPLPSFFRFRSVCRRFYTLLFSNPFLELHIRVSPSFPSFLFFQLPHACLAHSATTAKPSSSISPPSPPPGYMLDATADRWYSIPFQSTIPPGFSPAASSGGLLCWVSAGAGPKTVILSNPLSRLAVQLPAATRPRLYPSTGLTVSDSSFSVVVAGDDLISPFAVKNLTTEAFHVDGGTGFYSPWETSCPLPRLCNLESGRMVFRDGKFYSMSHSPFSVLAYDVAGNEWGKLQAPMRRFLRSPSLVECAGRVVLVAMVEKSKLNVPRSVRVWELESGGRGWAEVERMPQHVFAGFEGVEGGRGFECVGQGGVLAVCVRAAAGLVLLFEWGRRAWRWAPPCPFVMGGDGGGMRGFGFEPRLATPAIGLLEAAAQVALLQD